MIAVKYVKNGRAPINVVLASNRTSYPAIMIAADKRSYKILDIGDPSIYSLNKDVEEWSQAKQCMFKSDDFEYGQ